LAGAGLPLKFPFADHPGLGRLQRRQDRVAPLFRLQNISFSANWIEGDPPIWYSGLNPPFTEL